MIMSMFDIICVTSRRLCSEPLEIRISKLLDSGVDRIILREKDLLPEEYLKLAKKVLSYNSYDQRISLHCYDEICCELNHKQLHLPLTVLKDKKYISGEMQVLGASVHSVDEAATAEKLGADYITAGHIFATECKLDVPPRGIKFLKNICENVRIPVYAIGGINASNISLIKQSGAKGVCIMSGFMSCENVKKYVESIKSVF